MKNYQLIEKLPAVNELNQLRTLVGWGEINENSLKLGLDNSLYGVCILLNGDVVGTARVVGDNSTCFYIQDVIIHPDHQRKGIGASIMEKIMNYIYENACNEAVVGLMSVKGKEEFYKKFGFWTRPTGNYGAGMVQFIEK
ncbi:GNAT family N-acetyltransferase [Clostridium sp. YIM B02506]|uniref:GNAT family N-acetyltransferase n=1 Tax=Clostridium sp. YIM B02506 TaxID=2910680 RepID=UPI001EED8D2E|nr:GNAT family N-acetyltransferase [Clostridium sp. YIM B02506]